MSNLLFSCERLLSQRFLQTDLGQLYLSIPFEELASTIPPPARSISGKGCRPWFDVKGGIALQFLKHYHGLSDELLIEHLNTDWSMQYFCGIQLKAGEAIKDKNLPSYWRSYIGKHLDMNAMQKILAGYWSTYLNDKSISSVDATCYESRISYPTPIKLLWDCCQKVYLSYKTAVINILTTCYHRKQKILTIKFDERKIFNHLQEDPEELRHLNPIWPPKF